MSPPRRQRHPKRGRRPRRHPPPGSPPSRRRRSSTRPAARPSPASPRSRRGSRSSSSRRSSSASCSGWPRRGPPLRRRSAARLPARAAGSLARPARHASDAGDPARLRRRDRRHRRDPEPDPDPARERARPVHPGLPRPDGAAPAPDRTPVRDLRSAATARRSSRLHRFGDRGHRPGRGRRARDRLRDLPPGPDRRRQLHRGDLRVPAAPGLGVLHPQGPERADGPVRPQPAGGLAVRCLGRPSHRPAGLRSVGPSAARARDHGRRVHVHRPDRCSASWWIPCSGGTRSSCR